MRERKAERTEAGLTKCGHVEETDEVLVLVFFRREIAWRSCVDTLHCRRIGKIIGIRRIVILCGELSVVYIHVRLEIGRWKNEGVAEPRLLDVAKGVVWSWTLLASLGTWPVVGTKQAGPHNLPRDLGKPQCRLEMATLRLCD